MNSVKKIREAVIILVTFFCLMFSFSAFAEENGFTVTASKSELMAGENLKLSINYAGNQNVRGFLIKVSYDEEQLRFLRSTKNGDFTMASNDSGGECFFACTADSNMNGTLMDLVFGTAASVDGTVKLDVSISQICSADGQQCEPERQFSLSVDITPPLSDEAMLLSLTPSTGEISPEFSPEIFEYAMSVPYAVKSVSFSASSADGASFTVNRKNLGGGGSTTDFIIKVKAADGVHQNQYTVKVTREEYKASVSADSSGSEDSLPLMLSLTPSVGNLNEEFDPLVNEYSMDVDYSVRSLTFYAELEDGASVSVNRKNLGSGGSTTEFRLTVKSAELKNIYIVNVQRGEYQRSSSGGSSGTSSKTSGTTGGSTSQSSSSSKQNSSSNVKSDNQQEVPEDGFYDESVVADENGYSADSGLTIVSGGGFLSEGLLFGIIVVLVGLLIFVILSYKGKKKGKTKGKTKR